MNSMKRQKDITLKDICICVCACIYIYICFPGGTSGKNSAANAGNTREQV